MIQNPHITQLLEAWSGGDAAALDQVMALVYDQLHRIAARHLRRERPDHALQTTELINEAYVALVDSDVAWNDRTHFFAVASNVMRRILIDQARAAGRQKRGGDFLHVTLHESGAADARNSAGMLELDAALTKLERIDPRKAAIVEMHFFGGLTYEEIADVLKISAATVNRELRFSKAWMQRELGGDGPTP